MSSEQDETVTQWADRRLAEAKQTPEYWQEMHALAEAEVKALREERGACGICWTVSWEPCEEADCDWCRYDVAHDGEHRRCLCCWQKSQLTALEAEVKALREQLDEAQNAWNLSWMQYNAADLQAQLTASQAELEELTSRLAYVNVWAQALDAEGGSEFVRRALPDLFAVLDKQDRTWLDAYHAKDEALAASLAREQALKEALKEIKAKTVLPKRTLKMITSQVHTIYWVADAALLTQPQPEAEQEGSRPATP